MWRWNEPKAPRGSIGVASGVGRAHCRRSLFSLIVFDTSITQGRGPPLIEIRVCSGEIAVGGESTLARRTDSRSHRTFFHSEASHFPIQRKSGACWIGRRKGTRLSDWSPNAPNAFPIPFRADGDCGPGAVSVRSAPDEGGSGDPIAWLAVLHELSGSIKIIICHPSSHQHSLPFFASLQVVCDLAWPEESADAYHSRWYFEDKTRGENTRSSTTCGRIPSRASDRPSLCSPCTLESNTCTSLQLIAPG